MYRERSKSTLFIAVKGSIYLHCKRKKHIEIKGKSTLATKLLRRYKLCHFVKMVSFLSLESHNLSLVNSASQMVPLPAYIILIVSLIVIFALLGNSLVIYVLFTRRKTFLKKPYSIFILNLAIADFLTAIFLIFRYD